MKNNPFVLPGFGQTGPLGENPILASMEMMRQAWEGLASSGNVDATAMSRLMSVEEMDKRISDLRAVENWLNMNVNMLRSTIQGLEVQRATLSTLKSFMDSGMGAASQHFGASSGGVPGQAQSRAREQDQAHTDAEPAAKAGADPETSRGQEEVLAAAASAAQGWWDMMQQQFQSLAAATAASAEGAMAEMQEAAAHTARQAASDKPADTAEPADKAAKKAGGVKTAGQKAAKSGVSRSTTAAKTASKSAPARKTTR